MVAFDKAWDVLKDSARSLSFCEKCGAGYSGGGDCSRCFLESQGALDESAQPRFSGGGQSQTLMPCTSCNEATPPGELSNYKMLNAEEIGLGMCDRCTEKEYQSELQHLYRTQPKERESFGNPKVQVQDGMRQTPLSDAERQYVGSGGQYPRYTERE